MKGRPGRGAAAAAACAGATGGATSGASGGATSGATGSPFSALDSLNAISSIVLLSRCLWLVVLYLCTAHGLHILYATSWR